MPVARVDQAVAVLLSLVAGSVCLLALSAAASASHTRTEMVSVGPVGGNGAFPASWSGASRDGSRVWFETSEQLVGSDTDARIDVYERANGQTTLVSVGSIGGNGDYDARWAGATPDGAHVYFETHETLTSDDVEQSPGGDVYERAGGQTTLVSVPEVNWRKPLSVHFAEASDDGTHVFLWTVEKLSVHDSDPSYDVYERHAGETRQLSMGPAGGNQYYDDVTWLGASADGTRAYFYTLEGLTSEPCAGVYEYSDGVLRSLCADVGYSHVTDAGRLFAESSQRLVPADTDGYTDVFAYSDGEWTLVSTGPAGGNARFSASLASYRASWDGSHVYFSTAESLVSEDSNTVSDAYQHANDQTSLVSADDSGAAVGGSLVGSAADGSHAFFTTTASLVPEDTDSERDIYDRSGNETTLVSTGPAGGNGAFEPSFVGASDDGARVFFTTAESLVAADGDSNVDVYERSPAGTTLISTGPGGGNGAFDVSAAPTATVRSLGIPLVFRAFGISEDGSHAFFDTGEALLAQDTDSETDVYARLVNGFPRPQGAARLRVPLVPLYQPCSPPGNRTHGPALEQPSCSPPAMTSPHLTLGTFDANGEQAKSNGFVRLTVVCEPPAPNPGPPCADAGDQADVALELSVSDVRNRADLTDYTGELQASFSLDITDKLNGPDLSESATVSEVRFAFTAPCDPTDDATVGSTCSVQTHADAVMPGSVPESKRSNWEVGQIRVFDGGPDGLASTADNRLFLRQGVFVP